MVNSNLKILVSSYACGPNWGSEVGMGWNWVTNLSQFCQLYVIVEKGFQQDIEKTIPKLNLKFTPYFYYVEIEEKARVLASKQGSFKFYSYYKSWQKRAYILAKHITESESIDIVHQLNMIGFREPGYLWQIDKPFVWGPIGGMNNVPFRFIFKLGWYGIAFNLARNTINNFQIRYKRRVMLAASHPHSSLISVMPVVQSNIRKYWKRDSIIIPEVGASINKIENINKRSKSEPLNIVWSGMHHPSKALPFLLKSLSKLTTKTNYKLHILGTGNQTLKWKKLAKDLRIDKNCLWHGLVPHQKALSIYQSGHLFCITSLRDATSTVLMEALSFGLPVICPDHCGFAGVIDSSCGYKIKLTSPKDLIKGISQAIYEIHNDESKRQLLSLGALKKAEQFSWNKNAERVFQIYQELLKE